MSKIYGNMVGAYSNLGKTFVIEDENGNELTGVITDIEQIFSATTDDVNAGKVFASNDGIQVGTQHAPAYNYAIVDTNGLCIDVYGTHLNYDGNDKYITISEYEPSYIGNYYNAADGKWYVDAEFSTEVEGFNN